MKKVLITGGAGFIGSNLAIKLIAKGYKITVLDNLSEQIHGPDPEKTSITFKNIADKVDFVKGSVTSHQDWKHVLSDHDVIVHYAAETGTGQSMYQVNKYTDVNINGTAIMLDSLANNKHRVKKVLLASSRALYGEGKYHSAEYGVIYPGQRKAEDMSRGDFEVKYPGCKHSLQPVETDEASKIHPSSVYGITKQVQEQLVMTVCPTLNVAPVAFRYQNVYGPGQSLKNPYTGILSIFSTSIKNHNPLNIFEDGKETRDFIFIDDVVDATILGIENDAANGEIFNVGTGVPTTVATVANALISNYGIDVPASISGNFRLGDIRHNFADITKIKALLGFNPYYSFENGIKLFSEWVNMQPVESDTYPSSIQELIEKGYYK